jgi:hypothetical protein
MLVAPAFPGTKLRDLITNAPDEVRRDEQELMLVPAAAGRGLTAE